MGTVTKIDKHGRKERRIGDMEDRARLQIDTRKWALAKLLPKKFGDHVQIDTGPDKLQELIDGMTKMSKKVGPPEGQQTEDDLVQ